MYESEDDLQTLLEASPELLLGGTTESNDQPAFLLVRREAGVPELDGGSDRWFLDHLFLDAKGVPTLVEVKRSTDSRIRREVVGQMLDYAANILAHWPPERMRNEFEARCAKAEVDPVGEVLKLADAEYEDFWTVVKTNLAAKRLRLVFVADHIPISLQTIVEFLNEQLRNTEVLAIEVKQHKGDGFTVLTTQIIGRTSTAQSMKSVGEKREWDAESALDELRRAVSFEAATVADRLLQWAGRCKLGIVWGKGAKVGGAYFAVPGREGASAHPFGISTDGKLDLYPPEMRRLPPFDQDDRRVEFMQRIGAATATVVEDAMAFQSFKSFPLNALSAGESFETAVAALDWFVAAAADADAPALSAEE